LKRRRTIGFILAILLGTIAGLLYGWFVQPPAVKNTTLSTLRSDYQADYVLMVARAYPETSDLAGAMNKLKELNRTDPLRAVQEALLAAQQLGYPDTDLRALAALEMRLSGVSEVQSGGAP